MARDPLTMPAQIANRTYQWLRAGLVLVPILLGAALVSGALSNQTRTREASNLLVRAEIDGILRTVGHALRGVEVAADATVLNEILDELHPEGVRYLALLSLDGTVVAAAGTRSSPSRTTRLPGPIHITRAGALVQVTASFPVGRFRRRALRFLEPRGIPPFVTFEFNPQVANRLRQDADRTFTLSIIATTLLSLMAAGLWWQLRRWERQSEARERERRLAQLGEMSAVLAHEIRNPLASLKGQAQLLVEQLPEGGRESKKAHRIVAEALRLEKLSGTLLDFVRSGSVDRQPVDPAILVRQAAENFAPGRICITEQREVERTVMLDPLRMQQVLQNLLENAVQASTDDVPVEVTLLLAARRLSISIRDYGPGLPAGEENKIFNAFQTTKPHGTGLGLAVARRIVELHGGTLTAQQHPTRGAVFTLEIPS